MIKAAKGRKRKALRRRWSPAAKRKEGGGYGGAGKMAA